VWPALDNIVRIAAVFPWLTADVTNGVVMNQVAGGLCCTDKDAVFSKRKGRDGTVLIASTPPKRCKVLNSSFGVMKYFGVKEESYTYGKKEEG
jgi:hypothetical protein